MAGWCPRIRSSSLPGFGWRLSLWLVVHDELHAHLWDLVLVLRLQWDPEGVEVDQLAL